ncbi:MAG: CDP-glycerol glycerophosphotransferase family protein, partial [Stackebrandtia sp.]
LTDVAAPNGLPIAAVLAFLLLPQIGGSFAWPWPGYLLSLATFGYGWYRYRADGLGQHLLGRATAIAAVLMGLAAGGEIGVAESLSGTLLIAIIAFEPRLLVALTARRLATANLPVRRSTVERWNNPRSAFVLVSALSLVFLLSSAFSWGKPAVTAVCSVAALGLAGGTVEKWLRQRRRAHTEDNDVLAAVTAHGPRFAVHFAAPEGSEYQLRLWLPYFDKLGDPYLIILRDREFLPEFAARTKTPVVVAPSITDLESMLVPGIKAVFYVNNSMHNAQCVRFAHLTHVQLMHGDSDKPASYNPISAMYDRIFVAGQAGIDRYHNHGIDIPGSRFRVVGHPQVAEVNVGPRGGDGPPVALYAPTWTGLSEDVNFCSLPMARDICAALIARGVTVIVRPHPYTRRNPAAARQLDAVERLLAADAEASGRAHKWGKTTSEQMSLVDCVNAADVMITDASGAASDWLYSEKPFAVTDITGLGDKLTEELPLAHAAYVIRSDRSNLEDVCEQLLESDSLAADRHKMKAYYLGGFPAETYADAFFTAAHDCY